MKAYKVVTERDWNYGDWYEKAEYFLKEEDANAFYESSQYIFWDGSVKHHYSKPVEIELK